MKISHTNHSVCLKPAAANRKNMINEMRLSINKWTSPMRQTISSHSLMVWALRTTQQKPVDKGFLGSLSMEPITS